MKLNDKIAHRGQSQPENMSKSLYDSGVKGCEKSNIGYMYNNLPYSLLGWVSDDDSGNFESLGHRRWVLNPTMKNTGFGLVDDYSAMYSFDEKCPENKEKNVAWPCQNMPIEFFNNNFPWSLSTNKVLKKKVKVTITNKKTNKITKFDKITPNKFSVDNNLYGQAGCVIFRPNFKYTEGDSFRVDVDCTDFSVSYDVNFFNIECTHDKELLGTINSSCIKKGKLIYFCDKCGIIEKPLALKPHEEKILSFTKANCKTKGRKKSKCCFCLQNFDEEIDIQPHDYIFKKIKNSSETEGTCKDCGKKIEFTPPTNFRLWFKKENEGGYSSEPPLDNPIGSIIVVWVQDVDGDEDHNEIIFEVSNPKLLKLPIRILNIPNNKLKVIGEGKVEVICYAKYNPSLKKKFSLVLG